MSIEKLQQQYHLELRYTLFPLHPDTPEEGLTMEEMFRGRNIDIQAAKLHLQQMMEKEGLEYGNRNRSYNSRLAQELAKWSENQAGGDKIHNALYRAYFVDGLNLAKIGNLVSVAKSINLDGEEVERTLKNRLFRQAVDKDWQYCFEIGVTAVPTYICGEQRLVGAQSLETLEKTVVSAGAKAK